MIGGIGGGGGWRRGASREVMTTAAQALGGLTSRLASAGEVFSVTGSGMQRGEGHGYPVVTRRRGAKPASKGACERGEEMCEGTRVVEGLWHWHSSARV